MIPLVLVTGFLGSGKTTLLQLLARQHRNRRVAWVVNEFSARDMDTERLAAETERVLGIAGGSIFCRCKATEFIEVLSGLPERFDPEAVVIEASGMADPVAAGKLLRESGLDRRYEISAIVAVVDPGSLLKLLHTLPNIRAQIEAATLILVNKNDLHPPEHLERTEAAVREINPTAPIVRTRYGETDADLFGSHPGIAARGALAPCVDPHFEKFEADLTGELDLDRLKSWVEAAGAEIYRVKGIAWSGGRLWHLDYSASGWRMEEAAGNPAPALVLIARAPFTDAVRRIVDEWVMRGR